MIRIHLETGSTRVVQPIYRWDGRYFGFISGGRLFGTNSDYLGWVDDSGRVWRADGQFLGELVNESYILRRQSAPQPLARLPRLAPVPPIPPAPRINRVGRVGRVGWIDALLGLG